MSIRYDLLAKLPENSLSYIVYYPDIIPFWHTKLQYLTHWHSLTTSKYIYTNGYIIQPTNSFMYAFQTFKGWLGFENHCKTEKVRFNLEKLAYYGYLRGYEQTIVRQMQHYPLPADYLDLIETNTPRKAQTTQALQRRLILDYNQLISPYNSRYLKPNYPYGQTLNRHNLLEEIPFLDPQDTTLIKTTVEHLEPIQNYYLSELKHHVTSPKYTYHKPSLYAQALANHYISKAKAEKEKFFYGINFLSSGQSKAQILLEQAQQIDPTAFNKELYFYIDHHLERKELAEAIDLMNKLDNLDKALKYLLEQFTAEQRLIYVKKDTPLALKLAQHILQGNNTIKSIEIAESYDSNLQEHNPDKAFTLLIQRKQYDDAYALFEKHHQSIDFPKSQRSTLALHFDNVGESLYEIGAAKRTNKQWTSARNNYLDSLLAKKKAAILLPDEYMEVYYTHKRLYAQLLIDSELESPKCQPEVIIKAIKLLDSCYSKIDEEKERHKKALVKGLMCEIAHLISLIKVSPIIEYNYKERINHFNLHQSNFRQIRTSLLRVIELLTGTKDSTQKLILAQAHYTLADMTMYFDLGEDYLPHFKRAAALAPGNPVYLLTASELFPDEKSDYQSQGVIQLKSKGYQVLDYNHWYENRWHNNELAAMNIPDIHALSKNTAPSTEKHSWFSL